MPKYLNLKRLYSWHDIDGSTHILVAKSINDAKQILLQRGELFFKLKAKGYITQYSFKKPVLIIITKQLATMLKAGLPIIESLTILAQQHPLIQWQWLLMELTQKITTGEQLSQSMSHYPEVFSKIYQEIIATGELTGQLEQSFETLYQQLERTQQLHKKIYKAVQYPIFLLSVAIVVTLIMLLVVLPKFAEVYQSFDAQLPKFTQLIITLSNNIKEYYMLYGSIVVMLFLVYQFYLKKHYPKQLTTYYLSIPIIGNMIRSACLAQIFQTLSTTQKSGIPLITGLITAQKTVQNLLFMLSLSEIINTIKQGQSFSLAISKNKLYPTICKQLIQVGEESGTLDLMLTRLADFYQQNSIELADNLSQKIEPLMMCIMAIIIGSLVIGMYLPVFQLGSIIH